ncbi:MAG: porin family protein [Bacteroidota bacterium]
MKTFLKTISVAIALVFAFSATAQTVSFGLKTGVQSANVKVPGFIGDISQIPDFKSITTFNVGAVSEIGLHKNFAIQPELTFTQKGFKLSEDFDVNLFNVPLPIGATAVTRFNYLEMPLLAKAKFGNERSNFYLLAGPTIGYAMSGKLDTRAKLLIELDLFETPIDLDAVGYQRWEIGGMAGAGVSFNTGGGSQLFFDVRYSHGFSQPYDIPVVRERVQHNSIGVNIGFTVPFGGKNGVPRA